MSIINITDPATPTQLVNIPPDTNASAPIPTSVGVTTTEIRGGTYAVVSGLHGHGVQIVNITNPAAPTSVVRLNSDVNGFSTLRWWPVASAISEVSGGTYAVVANHLGGLKIINITEPAMSALTAGIKRDSWADGLPSLDGAVGVEVAEISDGSYAVIASHYDNSVLIINITDPANPALIASIIDGTGGFTELRGAWSVAISEISNKVYAIVASPYDSGMQIIDISNPANPVPVAGITADTRRTITGYPQLGGVFDVEVAEIYGGHYAVASSITGAQIIDITDPSLPTPVTGIQYYVEGVTGSGIRGIEIAEISGRTYVVAASLYDDDVQIIDITDPAAPSQPLVKP